MYIKAACAWHITASKHLRPAWGRPMYRHNYLEEPEYNMKMAHTYLELHESSMEMTHNYL